MLLTRTALGLNQAQLLLPELPGKWSSVFDSYSPREDVIQIPACHLLCAAMLAHRR